jgi:chromosome segregation ATPase
MNTTEPTTLILAGEGYNLTIAPEAEARKAELLSIARAVQHVRDNDESADAQYHSRSLAAMRIEVEKCRKAVKEPVNRIGKLIDQTAAAFVEEIAAEEKRITRLVGDHAEEVARLKREKEEAERRAFEESRAAREAAEAAAAAAESTGKISDIVAAKQAMHERTAALVARMAASEEVAETKIAQGVRFAWDFEVTSIDDLARLRSDLVTVEPKRAAILAQLKAAEEEGVDTVNWAASVGIHAFKRPIVSSR